MKKIIYILSAVSLLLVSCNTKKADEKIAGELNELKDSLNIDSAESKIESVDFPKETLLETFTTTAGDSITFEEIINTHKGKVTVIDVWASWCPDCIKGFPKLVELQNEFPDVNYVYVSLDKTTDKWKESIEKYNLKGSHYHINQKMKDSFGASIQLDWIPRYIVVNKEGKIILQKAIVADDQNLINILKIATS